MKMNDGNNISTYLIKRVTSIKNLIYMLIFFLAMQKVSPQFIQPSHRQPQKDEIAVTEPGIYAVPGASYILMNDISSLSSSVFLGKDVTFDLNGFSITFADGGYEHIPNYGFEEGLKGWDVSKAPGAEITDRKKQVMIGEKTLSLKEGDEIISQFINLPVQGRSYFAICGVASHEMKVSVFVEDITGNEVRCRLDYGNEEIIACPAEELSPRLGGGIVYAHLAGISAGKYRLRVKALTDCIIDYADIRPALDVGIGIVKEVQPQVNYKHLYNSIHGAFYDYRMNSALPSVRGKGTVTIKNGTIINGTEGILSWGIQSTADSVLLTLENIMVITSGINTNAVDAAQAMIKGCTFDVDNPFIINRHGSDHYAVDLWGKFPSEVLYSEFYGGQGCLVFKGAGSKIHHNFFANRQTVTNHYSIMAMGDSSKIFENRIAPELGSGIEIYIHRAIEIYNNEFSVEASPPTCEYGHSDYSSTAIRIADYGAGQGSERAAFGNRIYNNKIVVTGKDFPEYTDYVPMAWAVFYSASGGDNYFFRNEISVEDLTPQLKNETGAFYVGGASDGYFFENIITTNVPAFWIASRYGSAENIYISGNVIIKSGFFSVNYTPVRMGWHNNTAKNIIFQSNINSGSEFEIDRTTKNHSFCVYWTLKIMVRDNKGKPVNNQTVIIYNSEGNEVANMKTGPDGELRIELPEYSVSGSE
ncbi:MAG: hypothetical protein ACUVTX_05755, partial [Bacteroidales bacterium]